MYVQHSLSIDSQVKELSFAPSRKAHISLASKVFEDALKLNVKFKSVIHNNDCLFSLLKEETDLDSFLVSPFYYAFTGRKGLWIYTDDESYVPLCWHPNQPGTILIFPGRGKAPLQAFKKLIDEIPPPPNGMRVARLKSSEIGLWSNVCKFAYKTAVVEETILDWTYPIRVLSTEIAGKMLGGHFAKTRNHMKQLQKQNLIIEDFNCNDTEKIVEFIESWARVHASEESEIQEWIGPYQDILKLAKMDFGIKGFVFYINGNVEALTLWEELPGDSKTANVWVTLSNISYNALSDFIIKTTAESLYCKGIRYLNLGGSETKSLDNFKNKFLPAYSLDLVSMDLLERDHLSKNDDNKEEFYDRAIS